MIGAGGHAKVLADIFSSQGKKIDAVIAPDRREEEFFFHDILFLNDEEFINSFSPEDTLLINGLGQLPRSKLRETIFKKYKYIGYDFLSIISNNAIISPFASLGEGVQILPGAIVQAGTSIGINSIINSGSIVEHDCRIGDHNHLSPRSTLCGSVVTGINVCIGAGATIIQNIYIGDGAIVGAGSVLTRNLPASYISFPGRTIITENKIDAGVIK